MVYTIEVGLKSDEKALFQDLIQKFPNSSTIEETKKFLGGGEEIRFVIEVSVAVLAILIPTLLQLYHMKKSKKDTPIVVINVFQNDSHMFQRELSDEEAIMDIEKEIVEYCE